MRRRAGTTPTKQPLRCYRCHRLRLDPKIVVEPEVEKRPRDGRQRDHVRVCCSNGHWWWSLHPEAIRQNREAGSLGNPSGAREPI